MIRFSFETHDTKKTCRKVKRAFKDKGGYFMGSDTAGSYGGKGFEGTYTVRGNRVYLTITKKPFFIPDFLIESRVRKFFCKEE
jgi:hypothetical protein